MTWWRVSVWGEKQGEPVAKYLRKGGKCMVIGEVEPPNVYVSKTGDHMASLEVKAQTVRFLDSRRDEDGNDIDHYVELYQKEFSQ